MANLTVYGGGIGLDVMSRARGLLQVQDSIFASLGGPAIRNHADNAPLPTSYSAFDDVGPPETENVSLAEETIIRGPVRFVNPIVDDFRLRPDSPGVDAGDPGASCEQEPAGPNPCRVDLGHLGDTPAARFR